MEWKWSCFSDLKLFSFRKQALEKIKNCRLKDIGISFYWSSAAQFGKWHADLQIWQSGDILTTKIRCPIVMTNFRSQNVTTLSKNEIRSQNVVADEDTIRNSQT